MKTIYYIEDTTNPIDVMSTNIFNVELVVSVQL